MKTVVFLTSIGLLSGCFGGGGPAASPSPAGTVPASPGPLPTGIVTVTFANGSAAVGRVMAANAFQACGSKTQTGLTGADTIFAGGACGIAFADAYKRAIVDGLGDPKSVAIVNSAAVSSDGKTALVTYVSGQKTAQALLTHASGDWKLAEPAPKPVAGGAKIAGGTSPQTLAKLQSQLKFDVTTPVVHVIPHV